MCFILNLCNLQVRDSFTKFVKIFLTFFSALGLMAPVTQPTCAGQKGTVHFSTNGGTGTKEYTISVGINKYICIYKYILYIKTVFLIILQPAAPSNQLEQGTQYSFSVRDQNGCTASAPSVTIDNISSTIILSLFLFYSTMFSHILMLFKLLRPYQLNQLHKLAHTIMTEKLQSLPEVVLDH